MSRLCPQPKTPHKTAARRDNNRLNACAANCKQQPVNSPIFGKCCSAVHDKAKCIRQLQQSPSGSKPTQIVSSLCNNFPYKASVQPNWFSPQSTTPSYRSQSCTTFSSPSSVQRKHAADYKIYEGGDLLKFFTKNCAPKRVSEVCLVNDHYILVKMPDSCWRRNSQIESLSEDLVERSNQSTPISMGCKQTRPRWPPTNTNNSPTTGNPCPLAKYLQGNRNRKVSPLRADNLQPIDLTKKKKNTPELQQTIDQEVFRGVTRIKKISVESSGIQEAPLDLSVKRTKHVTATRNETRTEPNPNPISLKSSVHNDVVLQHRGLMRLAGDLPYIDEDVTTMGSRETPSARGNAAAGSGPLRWLIKPFRRRPKLKVKPKPKPKKPKPPMPKVQAVVYKTYFVSWKRPPAPEPPRASLRRCRSALF